MFEILIRTLVPPVLMCTIRRRVWFWKVLTCPGSGGCGAVAHVPIHCFPLGFCAVASNDSPIRTHVHEFTNSLFITNSPQKYLADTNIVRRWIAVAVSTLPGIDAQRARYVLGIFLGLRHSSGADDASAFSNATPHASYEL